MTVNIFFAKQIVNVPSSCKYQKKENSMLKKRKIPHHNYGALSTDRLANSFFLPAGQEVSGRHPAHENPALLSRTRHAE